MTSETVEKNYILSLDLGTTNIRAIIYDKNGKSYGSISRINISTNTAEQFFLATVDLIKDTLTKCHLRACNLITIGISVQRSSFLLWDRNTGEVKTSISCWNDTSSAPSSRQLNHSLLKRFISSTASGVHFLTRNERMCAVSTLKFKTVHASTRLYHLLKQNPRLLREAREGNLIFGGLETWLLWRLTQGGSLAAEIGCASSTGLYDAFQLCWSGFIAWLLGIPIRIMPPVLPTSTQFGNVHKSWLGYEVPIHALVGDQMAATFGACCFQYGDLKLTMGTGIFINLNCGTTQPLASLQGWSPIVGWQVGSGPINYLAESHHADCGTIIDWLKTCGYFSDYDDLEQKLKSIGARFDYSYLVFMPFFCGIQTPMCNPTACCAFLGLKPDTCQLEMLYAAMQSLAMMTRCLLSTVKVSAAYATENSVGSSNKRGAVLRVNGNVSKSNWLMQELADVLQRPLLRCERSEITCLGAAMLAASGVGILSTKADLLDFALNEKEGELNQCYFHPNANREAQLNVKYEHWIGAMKRTFNWPTHDISIH